MIFVTIGTVFPFDRMIRAMDAYAETSEIECIAQIGDGAFTPSHMSWHQSLPANQYTRMVEEADVIVSHAGMGSAITALQTATPIVMLPRRQEAGEHNTDHQMATARWLEEKPGVFIAWDEGELGKRIAEAQAWSLQGAALEPFAPSSFTNRLAQQLQIWTQDT
ncbi:MAG: glycosyltransferase [Pseudomonadota bacterium]